MKARDVEATLRHSPFRPFIIHVVAGRTIEVTHPEQVLLTPDKSTLVVALPDSGIQIVDMELVSSVSVKGRKRAATS